MTPDGDSTGSGSPPPGPKEADSAAEQSQQQLSLLLVETAPAWTWRPDALDLAAVATAILAEVPIGLPDTQCEAAVALSDDDAVRALNRTHRGKDQPTNVLSYPAEIAGPADRQPAADGEPLYLGDIILAGETVAREAAEAGIGVRDHTLHLIVHGVLHLRGFMHDDDGEAAAMERAETAILARLGIADPYADAELVGDSESRAPEFANDRST